MTEKIKGTVHGKTIELEQALRLPDGSAVSVSVELLPLLDEERRHRVLDLSGAWKDDPSIGAIFEEIARERRTHRGREVHIP